MSAIDKIKGEEIEIWEKNYVSKKISVKRNCNYNKLQNNVKEYSIKKYILIENIIIVLCFI